MAQTQQAADQSPSSEQDLSEGKLEDQDQLQYINDPPVRLAGYNQSPHVDPADLNESFEQTGERQTKEQ